MMILVIFKWQIEIPGLFVRLELELFCCGRMDGMVYMKFSEFLFLSFYTEPCSCLVVYLSNLNNVCMFLSLAHAHGVEAVPFMLAINKSESKFVGSNCVHRRCSLDIIRLFNARRTK